MHDIEKKMPLPEEIEARIARYRQQLLDFGMKVPSGGDEPECRFYKPVTELTAFIVNLHSSAEGVVVVYGYASTAFTRMIGDENALETLGVADWEITIREKVVIRDEMEEGGARARVAAMYERYLHTEKEELLACAKAKRSEFIRRFAVRLKPMGFLKKGNTWTKPLENDCVAVFNAQKSGFSDEYYFNIYIRKMKQGDYAVCYNARVAPEGMSPMDWQLVDEVVLDGFLDGTVVPAMEWILHTPLQELGAMPDLWINCYCVRHLCSSCWVEKNLWESMEG